MKIRGKLLPLILLSTISIWACSEKQTLIVGDSLLAFHYQFNSPEGFINKAVPGRQALAIAENPPVSFADSVVILAGENDLAVGYHKEIVFESLLFLVRFYKQFGEVYLLTLPGVNVSSFHITAPNNLDVDSLNEKILALGPKENITVIDLHSYVSKNGELSAELTYDGIHFNQAGWKFIDHIYNGIQEDR